MGLYSVNGPLTLQPHEEIVCVCYLFPHPSHNKTAVTGSNYHGKGHWDTRTGERQSADVSFPFWRNATLSQSSLFVFISLWF
jgi:hypothetical protein